MANNNPYVRTGDKPYLEISHFIEDDQTRGFDTEVSLDRYLQMWDEKSRHFDADYVFIPDLRLSGRLKDIRDTLVTHASWIASNLDTHTRYTRDNYRSEEKVNFSTMIYKNGKITWSPPEEDTIANHFQAELKAIQEAEILAKYEAANPIREKDIGDQVMSAFDDGKVAIPLGMIPFKIGEQKHLIYGSYPTMAIHSTSIAALWNTVISANGSDIELLPTDDIPGLDLPLPFRIVWAYMNDIEDICNEDDFTKLWQRFVPTDKDHLSISLRDRYLLLYYLTWFGIDKDSRIYSLNLESLYYFLKKSEDAPDRLEVALASKFLFNNYEQTQIMASFPSDIQGFYLYGIDLVGHIKVPLNTIKSFKDTDLKAYDASGGLFVYVNDYNLDDEYIHEKVKVENRKINPFAGYRVESIQVVRENLIVNSKGIVLEIPLLLTRRNEFAMTRSDNTEDQYEITPLSPFFVTGDTYDIKDIIVDTLRREQEMKSLECKADGTLPTPPGAHTAFTVPVAQYPAGGVVGLLPPPVLPQRSRLLPPRN